MLAPNPRKKSTSPRGWDAAPDYGVQLSRAEMVLVPLVVFTGAVALALWTAGLF